MDMQVKSAALRPSSMTDDVNLRHGVPPLDDVRLDELMRWHGTDESNLPPAHTLQNLSRDTVLAIAELQHARETISQLRSAMGRAFWATEFRDVHATLLEALGPPPDDSVS